jgi:hypothetical protein
MDAVVYDALALLHLLVAGCERVSLALAAAAGVAAWSFAESAGASLVVRASGGAVAVLGALVWRTMAA